MTKGEINGHLEHIINQVEDLDAMMGEVREKLAGVLVNVQNQNARITSLESDVKNNLKFRYVFFGVLLTINLVLTLYFKFGGV